MNTYSFRLNCDAHYHCIYSFDEEVAAVKKEVSEIFGNKTTYSWWDGDIKHWILECTVEDQSLEKAIKQVVDKIVAKDGILEIDSIFIDYHQIVDLL